MSALKLVLSFLGALLLVLILWQLVGHRIDRRGFEQIRVGMAPRDVEAALAAKPGIYLFLPFEDVEELRLFVFDYDNPFAVRRWEEWISESGAIHVGYDLNDRVICKYYVPRRETWLTKMRVTDGPRGRGR